MLSVLLLHYEYFKYVNEMSDFPSYNGKCPLVVLLHISDLSLERQSMFSTSTHLKEIKVFG